MPAKSRKNCLGTGIGTLVIPWVLAAGNWAIWEIAPKIQHGYAIQLGEISQINLFDPRLKT